MSNAASTTASAGTNATVPPTGNVDASVVGATALENVGIIFVPDIFGSRMNDDSNELIWPFSMETVKSLGLTYAIELIEKAFTSGVSTTIGDVLDKFKDMGDDLFGLWQDLVNSGSLDVNAIKLLPPDFINKLSQSSTVPDEHNIVDYIIDMQIMGTNIRLPMYANMLSDFRNRGYIMDSNLFTFGYDFRASVDSNASVFRTWLKAKADVFRRNHIKRFVLVGHGLGGLIVRRAISTQTTEAVVDLDLGIDGSIQCVICFNSPLNGTMDAVVCSAGLGRHPLITVADLKAIGRWDVFVDLYPDTMRVTDGMNRRLQPTSTLDIPNKLMVEWTSRPKRHQVFANKKGLNVYSVFGGNDDETPFKIVYDTDKNVSIVVYTGGDGLLTDDDCRLPNEKFIRVTGGHYGIIKNIANIVEKIISGKHAYLPIEN